jgi:tetratricopeptide (TPR) repeat protein
MSVRAFGLTLGIVLGGLVFTAGVPGPGLLSPTAASAQDGDSLGRVAERIHEVHRLFRQWRYDEAMEKAEALYADHPALPQVQYVAGRAKFYMQDYAGALALLERAAAGSDRTDETYLEFARATRDITRDYVSATSENFEIRVAPGPDEILIPYALDALEKAYANLGADFDYFPKRRIVVETFTRAEDLAAVSGLPVEAIRNSGTVAICKHNKLMITSPRALLMGYTWLDTLAHEYVHYVVSRISDNTVPIWLHEGVAKYQETRWRGEAGLAMSPYAEGLLSRAARGERPLITFEQMHPSMALLPTQEDTSQAFAQVFSVVEYIVNERGGYPALRRIIDEMKAGKDDAAAVQAALGVSFEAFQEAWRTWLRARPMRVHEHARLEERTFADDASGRVPGSAEEDLDAGAGIEDSAAERHTRLGDLLRMRSRHKAAAIQYEKAYAAVGPRYPRLPNRLAVTHMLAGDYARAEAVLEEAREANPGYVTTHVHLGRLYLRTERFDAAEKAFLRAVEINPFDPEIHTGLLTIAQAREDEDAARQAARAVRLLQREREMRQWRRGSGEGRDAAAEAGKGFLSLHSRPWAKVIVDGEDTGMTTPVFRMPVEPGRREITLRHEATGTEQTLTVEVEEGAQVERSVTFE